MKFTKYLKESSAPKNTLVIDEEFHNPDKPSFVDTELDTFYAPVKQLIDKGEFEAARKELDLLEADLNELDAANSKKKFFRFPQFMIDSQRKQINSLRSMLPKNESIEDMEKRCENCNNLLNDAGTCPKCDHGDEDVTDRDEEMNEELTAREKLKIAFPELNFDRQEPVNEECKNEELSNKEKLKRAFPELNLDKDETIVNEELSVREKLKNAYPELNFDTDLSESAENPDGYDDFDDDYYDLDDVEQDRAHASLYGGDRMYCDCGKKLVMTEWGGYCPDCTPEDPEDIYKD